MVVFKLYYQHIVRVENQTRLKAKKCKIPVLAAISVFDLFL